MNAATDETSLNPAPALQRKTLTQRSHWIAAGLIAALIASPSWAAEPQNNAPPAAPIEQASSTNAPPDPTEVSLDSITNLIETRTAKRADLKLLKRELKHPHEDSDLKQLEAKILALQGEIQGINQQIEALATGVDADEFNLEQRRKIDLKEEVEELLQPFIIMLQSATEQARQIENLRRTLSIAHTHHAIAKRAIATLTPLVERNEDGKVGRELGDLKDEWEERLEAVEDLITTTERQLKAKLDARSTPAESANAFARGFIRDRSLNLLKGLAAFFSVLFGLRFVGRRISAFHQARGLRKNFVTRVSSLVYTAATFLLALFAALVTFNFLNDWLLLGLTVIFIVALAWGGIRMLPSAIEQLTLYLNLGAVQENERVFFSGIPWVVQRLDFYCDLRNPVLEGGEFTVPIRELIGLQSRPVTADEPWFPTAKGDFVRLPEGVAKVLIQTPGMVEVMLEGGIRMIYPADAFFAMAPQNLSHGSRVLVIFGIAYRHQAIATGEFRDTLRAFLRQGLLRVLRPDQLLGVYVDTLATSPSSIDYEVECDLSGDAAWLFETIERMLTRLCIDACNQYGWEIPYPQLVVRRPSAAPPHSAS
jgi:hypothetical protein